MATIKPFKALRPVREYASAIAALPYDVYNRAEAAKIVRENPDSFLRVDRAETTLPDDVDTYAPQVYERARENLEDYLSRGMMEREDAPAFYLYELIMDGRTQTGLVACASVAEYDSGVIRKHELTRAEKEADRIRHVDALDAQTGPIFLTYRESEAVDRIIDGQKQTAPLYDFTSPDGITHRVWLIRDPGVVDALVREFDGVDHLYIADGHHRCASAARVAGMRREADHGEHPDAPFNYFLSVLFPAEQLHILPYNRVVSDLNGRTAGEFLAAIEERFSVEKKDAPVQPQVKGSFGMYLDGQWYELRIRKDFLKDDLQGQLDVSVLYDNLLAPVLGIGDARVDSRIDFVGGIRGLSELERRCREDMTVAFSMYPTSIHELMAIADAGLLMPPKSTWFEPKLRSGLFIHEIGQE